MTRKHFEAIAASIKESVAKTNNREEKEGVLNTAWNLAYTLSNFNPQFDRSRFLEACGYNEE